VSRHNRERRRRPGGDDRRPALVTTELSVKNTDAEIVAATKRLQTIHSAGAPVVCLLVLSDYNDDPRPLHEIPEVRPFMARVWELGLPSFLEVSGFFPELSAHPEVIRFLGGAGLGALEVWALAYREIGGADWGGGMLTVGADALDRFVEVELPALNGRADARLADRPNGRRLVTPEEHRQFLADNWEHLAAAAWASFRESGRGFLNIGVGKVQGEPALGEKFPPFCAYVPAGVLREQAVKFPNPSVEAMVRDYDPEVQVVAFFYWLESGRERHSAYRVMMHPPPRDTVYLGDVGQLKVRMVRGEEGGGKR
jgi:hypothetical protein